MTIYIFLSTCTNCRIARCPGYSGLSSSLPKEVKYIIVLIALLRLHLNCNKRESNTASLKREKTKQNQDALDKINFQYAHLVKPILGRDCLAPSLQFVGFTAKKEAAAENCREIFQNPRAKVQDFIMFAWVIVFFAKITVENKIEKWKKGVKKYEKVAYFREKNAYFFRMLVKMWIE